MKSNAVSVISSILAIVFAIGYFDSQGRVQSLEKMIKIQQLAINSQKSIIDYYSNLHPHAMPIPPGPPDPMAQAQIEDAVRDGIEQDRLIHGNAP